MPRPVQDFAELHSDSFWQHYPAGAKSLTKSLAAPGGGRLAVAAPMHRVVDVDIATDISDVYPQVRTPHGAL